MLASRSQQRLIAGRVQKTGGRRPGPGLPALDAPPGVATPDPVRAADGEAQGVQRLLDAAALVARQSECPLVCLGVRLRGLHGL